MERNLSFQFKYENGDCLCPDVVHVTPDPNTVADVELILIANTCIQALTSTHGLEHALKLVNDAAMGRLPGGTRFDTHWCNEKDDR